MKNDEFESIIDFAVKNEIDAYNFYRDASAKVNDQYLKETFENLAKEELEHKRFLEEFLASGVKKIKLDKLNDYKIAKTIDKPILSTEINFIDAIGLAVKNEEEAMNMYRNLANLCLDEDQKSIFLGLMAMEQIHKSTLEEIYLNVAYGEVW